MKLLPEGMVKFLISQFYWRKDKNKERVSSLLRELIQTCYSQGYAQGVKDGKSKDLQG